MKKRTFLLVVCFAVLRLSAAPVMADFVDFFVYDTGMTITPTGDLNGTTATGEINNAMFMNVNIKDDDGFVQETLALSSSDFDIAAVLNFTGSGNDYSATGSLDISDADGLKVAADFMSSEVTFNMAPSNYLEIAGYLSPQGTNASILLGGSGSTWDFVGPTETISLVGNIASFNFGDMLVIRYNVPYNSLQLLFQNSTVLTMGTLNATVMPIPAAVVLGILGLGVVGLKLRKYA